MSITHLFNALKVKGVSCCNCEVMQIILYIQFYMECSFSEIALQPGEGNMKQLSTRKQAQLY
jgi:hypothetical protein